MKKIKKQTRKVLITVGALICIIASVLVTLSFYGYGNLNNKDTFANAISAGQGVMQQYAGLDTLDGFSDAEKSRIRNHINQAIVDISTSIVTLDQQLRDFDPQSAGIYNQLRAITVEIENLRKDPAVIARQSRLQVFWKPVEDAEKKHIAMKSACGILPATTAAQRTVKTKCNAEVAKLKTALDAVFAIYNKQGENRLPKLEPQKVKADEAYLLKKTACDKLPIKSAAQRAAKTKCDADAVKLKKIADDLAIEIDNEKRYFEIDVQIKQKEQQKAPLTAQSMDLINSQNILRSSIYDAQVMRDKLNALKDRLKDKEIRGCMDPNATNPTPNATIDDGSCQYPPEPKQGCVDSTAANYDASAEVDDGSCKPKTPVCTTPGATNEDKSVSSDEIADESICEFPPVKDVVDDENPGDTPEPTACTCPTGAPFGNTNEKVYRMNAFITEFGGPDDKDPAIMGGSTGSVSKEVLKDLDSSEVYIAWPMPDAEKLNGFLDTAKCYGPEEDSWPGPADERIAKANQALNKQYLEVSYTNPSGVKKTVKSRIVDRGPENAGRIDASRGLWSALGLLNVLDVGPDPSKGQQVPLEIKLIPKTEGPGGCPQ